MNFTDIVGWTSAAILLLTIGRQVYKEWRTRSTHGLSKWLFIGQIAASAGFVVYSFLLENWVFVTVNAFIAAAAAVGQVVYLRNRRMEAAAHGRSPQAHRSADTQRGTVAQPAARPAAQPAAVRSAAGASKPGGTARHPTRRRKDSGERTASRTAAPPEEPAKGVITGEEQARAVPPPGALKRPRGRRARNVPRD
jgi:uncharacterized protein with PQ loop repeat